MKESHCLQLRRVGPEHLLNGTVALDRIQKRFVAAQHHFRHPCGPRCGNDLVIALHRLPMPRFAFTRRDLLTRVGLAHGPARTVGCCFKKDRPVAARHAFGHRLPPSRCVPMGGTDLSRRGLARSRTASTSEALLTRAAPRHALMGLVPLCCGGERKATDYHDMCDGMLYPRMTACEAAPKGLSRASPGCCNGPGGSVQSQPWHRAIPPGPAG